MRVLISSVVLAHRFGLFGVASDAEYAWLNGCGASETKYPPTKAKACWKIAFEENKHKAMKSLLIGCRGDVANALNSFVQQHS